ncbi:hypothetical protein GCM10010260_28270 [Streptomyces filipinensis]|uniref:Uncharacterized protein n=1 Tax=Streptomyces filipinensis TaxID=66887 RepID=A0A918MBD8_9ACTN|nr:hypothetical protein GCM10010260_28270 [Streptomyces filipinensis]
MMLSSYTPMGASIPARRASQQGATRAHREQTGRPVRPRPVSVAEGEAPVEVLEAPPAAAARPAPG